MAMVVISVLRLPELIADSNEVFDCWNKLSAVTFQADSAHTDDSTVVNPIFTLDPFNC